MKPPPENPGRFNDRGKGRRRAWGYPSDLLALGMTAGPPPKTRASRGTRAWWPFKFRQGFKQLRAMRASKPDGRGRPVEYTDEDYISAYLEMEAHARVRAGGKVFTMLNNPSVRLSDGEKPRRLDKQDRYRLRQLHSEGKRETEQWRKTLFMGRPHPQWAAIQRRIEARMEDLRQQAGSLFFLKIS